MVGVEEERRKIKEWVKEDEMGQMLRLQTSTQLSLE